MTSRELGLASRSVGHGPPAHKVWPREDGEAIPHLQIRALDGAGQPWRIAVNVQSDTGSEVVYWLVDPLQGHPILSGLSALPTGFSGASPASTGALDCVRAPLFS